VRTRIAGWYDREKKGGKKKGGNSEKKRGSQAQERTKFTGIGEAMEQKRERNKTIGNAQREGRCESNRAALGEGSSPQLGGRAKKKNTPEPWNRKGQGLTRKRKYFRKRADGSHEEEVAIGIESLRETRKTLAFTRFDEGVQKKKTISTGGNPDGSRQRSADRDEGGGRIM